MLLGCCYVNGDLTSHLAEREDWCLQGNNISLPRRWYNVGAKYPLHINCPCLKLQQLQNSEYNETAIQLHLDWQTKKINEGKKEAYGYVGKGVVPVRDVEGLNGWRCGAGARI